MTASCEWKCLPLSCNVLSLVSASGASLFTLYGQKGPPFPPGPRRRALSGPSKCLPMAAGDSQVLRSCKVLSKRPFLSPLSLTLK